MKKKSGRAPARWIVVLLLLTSGLVDARARAEAPGAGLPETSGAAAPASGVASSAWNAFLLEQASTCLGDPAARIEAPWTFSVGDYRYQIEGGRASLTRTTPSTHPGEIRLGVLSGIKEPDPATVKALEAFLDVFEKAQVDAVLVGGDSGFSGFDLEKVFRRLGARDLPVLVIAGNNESRSKLNRALRAVGAEHPNVLNLDLIRVLQGEGFGVVSLPGYHLKAFASSGASCVHHDADVRAVEALIAGVEGLSVLLAHGPPKQEGKQGTDWVDAETGNVGSALLAQVLARAKPALTIAGHILESGARATELRGRPVKPGKASRTLVINPGQVSALPYQLSAGWISHGTAALVSWKKGKRPALRWRLLKARAP